MGEINLANSSGRDALVGTSSVAQEKSIRWLDEQGRQASSVRFVKSSLAHDLAALLSEYGSLEDLSHTLVEHDPELDLENAGRLLRDTARVYVDTEREIVRNVRFVEVVRNPDGSVRERRPRKIVETNIAGDKPLRWSGTFIPRSLAVKKFVFSGKVQIHHVNGLTYDFLFGMAQELHERDSVMLLGGGSKSNQPLVLRRGGTPYRGFLEGRVQEDRYCLLLHFSNQELKTPVEAEEGEGND